MIALLFKALVVASVAGFALVQLEQGQELVVWELILLGIVVWELRSVPGDGDSDDPPLFDLARPEPGRLPRAIVATELAVIDAVGGHLGPDRRLHPILSRIASHRLARRGLRPESPKSAELLGERQWEWLLRPGDQPVEGDDLEAIVSSLEGL